MVTFLSLNLYFCYAQHWFMPIFKICANLILYITPFYNVIYHLG